MIAATLSGEFDFLGFEKSFNRYCLNFPQLEGRVVRDFNLAPYWRFPKENKLRPFILNTVEVSSEEEVLQGMEAALNTAFDPNRLPVKVFAARTGRKTRLGFIFDHRFFDARGAEMFLQGFQSYYLAGEKTRVFDMPPAPACLDRWGEQFESGRKVNRAKIFRGKNLNLRILENTGASQPVTNRFKTKSFDRELTRGIYLRSEKMAGIFMFLPYGLAFAIQAMHGLFSAKGKKQGDFIVPVTRDMRADSGEPAASLLFNHLSFLFFRISSEEAEDFERLLQSLKIQLYEQLKNKMSEALADAAMLIRIVPQIFLSESFRRSFGKPAVSFSFAILGESAYKHGFLMEARVENMVHMPRIPDPPGVGIFLSQYQEKLNVTLSYLDSLMNETESDQVLQAAAGL